MTGWTWTLPASAETWGWVAAGVVAVLLLGALAGWRLRRWAQRRRRYRRQRRAQWGEEAAAVLLEQHGYRLLASQARQACVLYVDGVPEPYTVRADYLVAHGRQRYVAEVKTGQAAPSATQPATRRQLLEYSLVFRCDGVLLVDMEQRTIQRVCFPRRG